MLKTAYIMISVFIMTLSLLSYYFFDIPVSQYFQALKGTQITRYFSDLTILGQAEYTLIPALFLYLFYKNKEQVIAQKAYFLFVSVALSGIIVLLIKVLAGRFRPELFFKEGLFGFDFLHIANSMTSFPSGHSATAMGATVGLGLIFTSYRYLFFALGFFIMISRVVIVRHYPSDIMIGGLIGALTSLWLYDRYFKERMGHV